jgi:microsomal prostaglandin-E synthase 2
MSLILTTASKAFSFPYHRSSLLVLRVSSNTFSCKSEHFGSYCRSSRNLSTHTATTVPDHEKVDNDDDEFHRYRYQLYQYKICPFSNIAKVYLNYKNIPFESVEVNPLTKSELNFSSEYRKVPILGIVDVTSTTPTTTAFKQLNGTEEILSHDYHHHSDDDKDADFATSDSSLRWQEFAKTKLAPLLYPNICITLTDSFRAFNYVHDENSKFSIIQRYSIQFIGSVAMYFAASKIKQKYKIDDVRIALDDALEELESELTLLVEDHQQQPSSSSSSSSSSSDERARYLFLQPQKQQQQQPHLGDLAVFSVLNGLKGLPLWNEIFGHDNSKFIHVRQWYTDVDEALTIKKAQTSRYGYND